MERERVRRAKAIRKLNRKLAAAEKREAPKTEIKRLEARIKAEEKRFMDRWKVVMK
jgi:hypothetical protein